MTSTAIAIVVCLLALAGALGFAIGRATSRHNPPPADLPRNWDQN